MRFDNWPRLDDGQVTLRPMTSDDWRIDHALSRDTAATRWTPVPENMSCDEARDYTAHWITRLSGGHGVLWVIESGGAPAGEIGVVSAGLDECEAFYSLLPTARGAKLAPKALGLVVAWARSVGGRRLRVLMSSDNTASERTAARAGLVRETATNRVIKGQKQDLTTWAIWLND